MRAPGFTLLEMLVVLVLLGLLIVGLQQGLSFGITASSRQEQSRDAIAGMDAADRAIRRMIEQIDPRDSNLFGGTSRVLRCATDLPSSATLPSTHIQATLAVDEQHRLILRWSPLPHVKPIARRETEDTLVLQGVERIEIAYAADITARRWLPVWQEAGLPPLIRVRLIFPPGDSRVWPDIIAAPARSAT